MSWAPHSLTQSERTPVFFLSEPNTWQAPVSVLPLSGVSVAASIHSSPVGSRLPLARQARIAWYQVISVLGSTPDLLAAYKIFCRVAWPFSGKVDGYGTPAPYCVPAPSGW